MVSDEVYSADAYAVLDSLTRYLALGWRRCHYSSSAEQVLPADAVVSKYVWRNQLSGYKSDSI